MAHLLISTFLNPKATAQPSNTGLEELKQLFICTAPSDAPFAADFADAKL